MHTPVIAFFLLQTYPTGIFNTPLTIFNISIKHS